MFLEKWEYSERVHELFMNMKGLMTRLLEPDCTIFLSNLVHPEISLLIPWI
jgi:hypothetical protein